MMKTRQPKTAKGRAGEAIRQLRTKRELGRSFDDCFEMGDGDEVVRIILERAKRDLRLRDLLQNRGFGCWLTNDLP